LISLEIEQTYPFFAAQTLSDCRKAFENDKKIIKILTRLNFFLAFKTNIFSSIQNNYSGMRRAKFTY